MMTTNTTANAKRKPSRRTGATVVFTPGNCPAKEAVRHGFSEAQAARMVKVRQTLPYVDDSTAPMIDARRLWERIGKPQGRFRDWAERDIKPLIERTKTSAQICAKLSPTKGRARKDYLLSRTVAAHPAMLAHTPEGDDIRAYFLDMESLAVKLAVHSATRVAVVSDSDNALTHALMIWAGDLAKEGKITRSEVRGHAQAREKAIKSMIADVLSGYRAGHWRAVCGASGGGIRDMLDAEDFGLYSTAYSVAVTLVSGGMPDDAIRAVLVPRFADTIDPIKYGLTDAAVEAAEAAVAEAQTAIDRARCQSEAEAADLDF